MITGESGSMKAVLCSGVDCIVDGVAGGMPVVSTMLMDSDCMVSADRGRGGIWSKFTISDALSGIGGIQGV